ncbi:MAG: 50S ribosomal protein L30 [Eubacteriales bacterium]|nr:50S ribosomal protein L30 [Eubacteriales bacterium]
MAKLKITLTKSVIGQKPRTRATVEALGLNKIGKTVEQEDNAAVRGMIQKVRHMVTVEEVQ